MNGDVPQFVLRRATPDDEEFVWRLRVATMKAMIEASYGWDEATQRGYARESLAGKIVIIDGEPVGVLNVADWGAEFHLAWVAIAPEMHGRGLGKRLVRHAMDEAARAGKPLSLQVLRINPATKLYERLGFRQYDENGPHKILMRWMPAAA